MSFVVPSSHYLLSYPDAFIFYIFLLTVLKPGTDSGAEKAIVLFKVQTIVLALIYPFHLVRFLILIPLHYCQPGSHPPEANGSAVQEENSKYVMRTNS